MDPDLLPFVLLLVVPLGALFAVLTWLFARLAAVSTLYEQVQRQPREAMALVRTVWRTKMVLNRRRLVRIDLTVYPPSGAPYEATTRCFLDVDVGTVLAIADRGARVPVLLRADDPSKVILDARSERLVREGLATPSAVDYR